jgi:hypothetical protein
MGNAASSCPPYREEIAEEIRSHAHVFRSGLFPSWAFLGSNWRAYATLIDDELVHVSVALFSSRPGTCSDTFTVKLPAAE